MSLVVESGAGDATAESYLSVADCTTYNTAHNAVAAWDSADSTSKERALRLATQYLEAQYGERWQGSRSTSVQALAWPRSDVELDGYVLSSTALPQKLKDACAELALRAVVGPLMPDITEPGTIDHERVKVGPIETETGYVGGRSQIPWFRLVDGLLRGLVISGDVIVRA